MQNEISQMRLNLAQLKFQNGDDKGALREFIASYMISGNQEVYHFIMEVYYLPNQKDLEANRRHNEEMLRYYSYYECADNVQETDCVPVWEDETDIIYVNQTTHCFGEIQRCNVEENVADGNIIAIVNTMWQEEIEFLAEKYRNKTPYLDAEYPVYLLYDPEYWNIFLQLRNLDTMLEKDRMVFLIGGNACRRYLEEDMVLLPDVICGKQDKYDYEEIIEETEKRIKHNGKKIQYEVAQYYEIHSDEIWQHMKDGTPSILFLTSRFSTAIQFHSRDCRKAAQKMGLKTSLLIESTRLHRIRERDLIKKLWKERPDMIFSVDHLRFEYVLIPQELFFVSWFQDPMELIFDKETPKKLVERDYCLNHFTTWKKFFEVGYSEKSLIEGAIPANQNIYHHYELKEEEKHQYECDICLVCHASNTEGYIAEILNRYPEVMRKMIEMLYREYRTHVYQSGNMFFAEEEFKSYVKLAFGQIKADQEELNKITNYIATDMYQWYNQRVLREVMVDWLLDAGFINIKLWGNGWKDNPKYAEYAMGPAENGETLSKIYQASKIVLGNNSQTTAAARAWEAMLSGAFYMSNYIPQKDDVTDIRRIMKVGEELVMFRDRDDLLEKVRFYLTDEQARNKMIRTGQKAALERMTYDKLMQRVIQTIVERC